MQAPAFPFKLLHVGLASLVAAVGFWLLWGSVSTALLGAGVLAVTGLLWWAAKTPTEVWAWATLLLGLESFAWPVALMVQLKGGSGTPTDEEMGTVLSAVVLGLFSSVFWLSFSYGLFKRAWTAASQGQGEHESNGQASAPVRSAKKARSSPPDPRRR